MIIFKFRFGILNVIAYYEVMRMRNLKKKIEVLKALGVGALGSDLLSHANKSISR